MTKWSKRKRNDSSFRRTYRLRLVPDLKIEKEEDFILNLCTKILGSRTKQLITRFQNLRNDKVYMELGSLRKAIEIYSNRTVRRYKISIIWKSPCRQALGHSFDLQRVEIMIDKPKERVLAKTLITMINSSRTLPKDNLNFKMLKLNM